MEVALIEAEPRLGGTCLLRGCIPSKALLHVARVIDEVQELSSGWGVEYPAPKIDIDKVRARKEKVISTLSGGLQQLAKRRKVKVIHARASFENSTTLRLDGDDASIPGGGTLSFDNLILASGSSPAMPPAFKVGSSRVMDSTGALELADIPESLLVIGGGYIGLEMGTVYAHLGTKVSVVELTSNLLPGADRDLVKPLQKRLQKLCEDRIFLDTKVGSVSDCGDAIEVTFEGPAKYGVERYSRVLVSVGRRPNSRDMGLENTNVVVTRDGWIKRIGRLQKVESTRVREGDTVLDVVPGSTLDHVVFFSSEGVAYTLPIDQIPATTGYGEPIAKHVRMGDGAQIVAAVTTDPRFTPEDKKVRRESTPSPYLLVVTSRGQVLRISLSMFRQPSTKVGRKFCRLRST